METLCGPHLFLSFYLLTLLVFLFISRFYGLLLLDFSIAFSKISFSLASFPELMDGNWAEGKRSLQCKDEDEEEEEEEEEEEVVSEMMGYGEDGRKRRMVTDLYSKRGSKAGGSVPPSCQVDSCKADLSDAKQYHRRHKVCEYHAKAPAVLIAEQQQRFCQQCSRFHELSEFDDSKRSCRRRLAGHNERRRKNAADYHGEGFHS